MGLHTALDALLGVIDRLLGPDGCPWDKEQSPRSLVGYCVEESCELVAALRSGRLEDVRDEMGDLLFLLLFLARLYAGEGSFTLRDVLEKSAAKMIRRHPHVFAGADFEDREEQLRAWERVKRDENEEKDAPRGIFAALPPALPSLVKAYRVHSKAARAGFTWPEDQDVEQQVEAEWLEFLDAAGETGGGREAQTRELGDLLFSIVELGRRKGIKADEALDLSILRFLARFEGMERLARERGLDFVELSLDEKDELWNEVKAAETEKAS
jgi:ATP diphosphatase